MENEDFSVKPYLILLAILPILSAACKSGDKEYIWKSIEVTVSAYNSTVAQTDGEPSVAAWGDTLVPGIRAIAVSRDLIRQGLDYNTQVKIKGLKGIYLVKDKMHNRWRNKIDIYMGMDVKKAKEWGRKKLQIEYRVKKDTTETSEDL